VHASATPARPSYNSHLIRDELICILQYHSLHPISSSPILYFGIPFSSQVCVFHLVLYYHLILVMLPSKFFEPQSSGGGGDDDAPRPCAPPPLGMTGQ